MKLTREVCNGVAVVTLHENVLDASLIGDFKDVILPILQKESQVVFDMNQIQFVDSSGVGAILSCLRILNAGGGDLKLCSLTKPVRALFELVRMHKIFDIFETKELAIESFKPVTV